MEGVERKQQERLGKIEFFRLQKVGFYFGRCFEFKVICNLRDDEGQIWVVVLEGIIQGWVLNVFVKDFSRLDRACEKDRVQEIFKCLGLMESLLFQMGRLWVKRVGGDYE